MTECVQAQAGQLVLRAGDTGRLPIHLITTAPLTNLSLALGVPAGRLKNLALEAVAPEICTNAILTPLLSSPMGEGEFYALTFATCSNQFFIGT